MKSIFIGALTGFILSCGNSFNKEPGGIDSLKNYSSDDSIACNYDYSITEYQRVDPGYQFSDEMIYFKKNKYTPKICSYYKNDSLVSLDLFGPEGRSFYSLRDIENDTLLDKSINAKKVRKVIKTESYIIDSGEKFSISNVDGNQIFYLLIIPFYASHLLRLQLRACRIADLRNICGLVCSRTHQDMPEDICL